MPKIHYSQVIEEDPQQLKELERYHRYTHLFQRVRMLRLLDTKDPALGEMFVKTTGVSLIKGKGGSSCYGDSGGPLFVPDQQTIVGVASHGTAPLCRGPGYYQRMDLPQVLKWVRSFP